MNFERELSRKLTPTEWNCCSFYVEKAQEQYNNERYADARESLLDAVAICVAANEYNAAEKIRYYLKFC